MKVGEILGGGIWVASTIKIAGYTWEAYTSTYNPFPGVSGGGGAVPPSSIDATASNTANKFHKLPVIGPLIQYGDRLFGQILSGGRTKYVTSEEIARLEKLTPPPAGYASAIKTANKGNMANLPAAANRLGKWGLQHGWKSSDIDAYLRYLGVRVLT